MIEKAVKLSLVIRRERLMLSFELFVAFAGL